MQITNQKKIASGISIKSKSVLAINGGQKTRKTKFPASQTIGSEEELAVIKVLRSGVLSRFLGTWHQDFYGGPVVQEFENQWATYFGVKHAVAVNSATSGLYAAVGAIGVTPGDHVIVSPYTMSASAVAPLVYNAIPIFADIEQDCFCLSAESIESRITAQTKAIIVVDIFGQSYDADKINSIAKKHNLFVIEDCAQAPGAKYKNRKAGTLADIGIYSLNYHKHIHTGEGGVVVTDNDDLAEKLRMIRNHAEVVADSRNFYITSNMLGFNYRMTEIEAAIGCEQLKKLDSLIAQRIENVKYLEKKLSQIPCLTMPKVRDDATHVYYLHAMKFDENVAGISRNRFVDAVKAELMPIELRETEGVKVGAGYVKPIYLQSIYQNKFVYGVQGFPWNLSKEASKINYSKGICPTVEKMYELSVITHELMRPGMTRQDLDDVAQAFFKVWENRQELS